MSKHVSRAKGPINSTWELLNQFGNKIIWKKKKKIIWSKLIKESLIIDFWAFFSVLAAFYAGFWRFLGSLGKTRKIVP